MYISVAKSLIKLVVNELPMIHVFKYVLHNMKYVHDVLVMATNGLSWS